ncbi:MAG TPA: NAD(P)-binding protein, partial [Candidatus Manganitrophaceae bacterium]|nr:NAD(P)-binding protein [Candidatus Manganitrophaceae bacterium]
MRENKKFDAVFVGSSLVSLAAAVALAKRGRSVALLDRPDDLASRVPDPTFHFSLGPFLYLGFEEGGAAEGFFSELALPIPTLKKKGLSYKKNIPYLQVVQARHRVDLHLQKEDYLDELKREFGGQLQQIKTFLETIEKEEALLYPYIGKFSQVELSGLGDRLNAWRQRLQFLQAVRNHQKKSATEFLAPFEFQPDFIEY